MSVMAMDDCADGLLINTAHYTNVTDTRTDNTAATNSRHIE